MASGRMSIAGVWRIKRTFSEHIKPPIGKALI